MSNKMKESTILKEAIVALYDKYKDDALVIRINSGNFKVGNRYIKSVSINGFPDVILIYRNSLFIGIEVKTSSGKLNENQIEFEQKCKERFIHYIVVRSAAEAIERVSQIVGENSNENY